MVYIAKKKIGRYEYLYLQKSFHKKGSNQKKYSKFIAYLGRADKYTKDDLIRILAVANNSTKKALNKSLDKYKENAG